MNARDFYYTVVAPHEQGRNYQQVHQVDLYHAGILDKKVFEYVPRFSNDILIDSYIGELLEVASRPIQERLKSVFVVKVRNFFPNAAARHTEDKYEGDLVYFYVGLSDLCFQYAMLFEEFQRYMDVKEELGRDDPASKELFVQLCEDVAKLCRAQVDWGINRNEIRLREGKYLTPTKATPDMAYAFATCMDKYVLAHELGHHFLGHTGRELETADHLRKRIAPLIPGETLRERHRYELEADVCALILRTSASTSTASEIDLDAAYGSLLLQTASAQLRSDIYRQSETHPSWHTRHGLLVRTLRVLYPSSHLEAIIDDVQRFQALLYHLLGQGLGAMTEYAVRKKKVDPSS